MEYKKFQEEDYKTKITEKEIRTEVKRIIDGISRRLERLVPELYRELKRLGLSTPTRVITYPYSPFPTKYN